MVADSNSCNSRHSEKEVSLGHPPRPSTRRTVIYAPMLAFQAFHLASYHLAHGTFQPPANGPALGCSDLDSLLPGGGDSVDLNSALDVCFDPKFSCSHAEVCAAAVR